MWGHAWSWWWLDGDGHMYVHTITIPDRFFLADPERIYNVYKVFIIIIIIPQAWVGSESIAHEIGHWLRGHKGERNNYCFSKIQLPYLFDYKPISAISRDPKLWTCRLSITRTKNKSKTPGYKPRPIHYYKTELVTTGKPNIFGKNHIDCHKWGLDDNTHARIQEMQWWFIMQTASLLESTRELINTISINRN